MSRKKRSGSFVFVFLLMFLVVLSFAGLGAEDIRKIELFVFDNYNVEEILEPEIKVPPDVSYGISNIAWDKKVSSWKPGTIVLGTVWLEETGTEFFRASYNGNECKVKGADFVNARGKDDMLPVRIKYMPVANLGNTEKASWSDSNQTLAIWKGVEYASAYELRLYEIDVLVKTIKKVEGNSIDLSTYITNESDYYYEVKAIPKDSAQKKYLREGSFVTSEVDTMEDLGETGGKWQESKDGVKYRDEDKTLAVNCWKYIHSKWYYFDQNGYRKTGWAQIDGTWYYMNAEGVMQTGWQMNGDSRYYLGPSGNMITGWVEAQPGKWYFMYPDGKMAVSTAVYGLYYVDAEGLWIPQ